MLLDIITNVHRESYRTVQYVGWSNVYCGHINDKEQLANKNYNNILELVAKKQPCLRTLVLLNWSDIDVNIYSM